MVPTTLQHRALRTAIKEFLTLVRSFRPPEYRASGPLGSVPQGDDYLQRSQLENFVRADLAKQVKWLDLAEGGNEGELLRDAEDCSLIVQEVRETPSTPLDVQGLLHAHFRPTLRVCRLQGDETEDAFRRAMHLSRDRSTWSRRLDLPVLYAGYQVGPKMEPVVFWRKQEELTAVLKNTRQRIQDRWKDLETKPQLGISSGWAEFLARCLLVISHHSTI